MLGLQGYSAIIVGAGSELGSSCLQSKQTLLVTELFSQTLYLLLHVRVSFCLFGLLVGWLVGDLHSSDLRTYTFTKANRDLLGFRYNGSV